jgi:outer membrane biosynthesis protein TonB
MEICGRRLRRLDALRRLSVLRASALVLLAAAGFTAAASPHAFGGAFQTSTAPTTAPPPDPPPTTVPPPDPAPPPPAPPPPPRPQPQPQPAAPPPPPPAADVTPPPPSAIAPPPAASEPAPARTTTRPRRRPASAARGQRPAPAKLAANPAVAALRLGAELGHAGSAARPKVLDATLASAPVPSAAAEQAASGLDTPLVLLVALGIGGLLLLFSATPDAVLVRGPIGSSAVRARVEVGLIGAAIVVLAGAVYLVVASS